MGSATSDYHTPVLGPEVAEWLVGDPDGVYVDATVGGGGHAVHLLERMAGQGRLFGIDRDPDAVRESGTRLGRYRDRVLLKRAPFWEIGRVLEEHGIRDVAGVLFDLGVSSHQIDDPARGFSYRNDGPLDMRMGPDAPTTAQDVANTYSQRDLTKVFRTYGEERYAGRIARAICRRRDRSPFSRTVDLADVIAREVRGDYVQKTLARIFQSIRIEVNGELAHLENSVQAAIDLLHPGGRIAVLTYHSLEDRIVKRVYAEAVRGCICPPGLPVCGCGRSATLRVPAPRGIRPGDAEKAANPRARSATMRVGERL